MNCAREPTPVLRALFFVDDNLPICHPSELVYIVKVFADVR